MAEEKGFKVNDRRFSTDDEEQSDDSQSTQESPPEAQAQQQDPEPQAQEPPPKTEPSGGQALPMVNFATLIISLSSSVLLHLGEIEDPQTGQKSPQLPLAKQTIDILAMLQEKTQGNLDEDEEQLLKNILYDLRMRYVQATK